MPKEKSSKPRMREVRAEPEFEQRIVDIARVTRVMAGGKRMRFRACVAIGDKKGRVAVAAAKGADVSLAVNKAVALAQKKWIKVPIVKDTIPHAIKMKFGGARILLKPAPSGTGIIAGGAVRIILELSGLKNVVSKILGSANKINNAKATLKALRSMQMPKQASRAEKSEQEKKPLENNV